MKELEGLFIAKKDILKFVGKQKDFTNLIKEAINDFGNISVKQFLKEIN